MMPLAFFALNFLEAALNILFFCGFLQGCRRDALPTAAATLRNAFVCKESGQMRG